MDMNRTLARKVVESIWPSWKIITEIGGGGYGMVYHAVNDKNDRLTAAVKIIPIPDEEMAIALREKRENGATEEDILKSLRGEADRAEILEKLKPLMTELPRGQQLREVLITDEPLPRTATGKIKRWELQQKVGMA